MRRALSIKHMTAGRHGRLVCDAGSNGAIPAMVVFGGVSLSGAGLEPDKDANKALYGKTITAKEVEVRK